jgi:hypothetical protein
LGGFRITPEKPLQEIGSREAEQLLGAGRRSISYLINTPLGQKHLVWRRFSDRRRSKLIFDRASVLAYREATKNLD